jgi:hypothetical protein
MRLLGIVMMMILSILNNIKVKQKGHIAQSILFNVFHF